MGLHKNYLKVGQNASNHIFGLPKMHRGSTPISMLISYGAKFNSSEYLYKCAAELYFYAIDESARVDFLMCKKYKKHTQCDQQWIIQFTEKKNEEVYESIAAESRAPKRVKKKQSAKKLWAAAAAMCVPLTRWG